MVQALEHQYQRGLLCINEELPQTEVSLVFKQGRLQFEPSLEELKTAHYKQLLKPFLSIPLNFKVGRGCCLLSNGSKQQAAAIVFPSKHLRVMCRPFCSSDYLSSIWIANLWFESDSTSAVTYN